MSELPLASWLGIGGLPLGRQSGASGADLLCDLILAGARPVRQSRPPESDRWRPFASTFALGPCGCLIDQPQQSTPGDRLRALVHIELGIDVIGVALDRVEGQIELRRDLLV